VLLVLVNDVAHVANLGDSRAVLCRRRKSSTAPLPPRAAPVGDDDVGGSGGTSQAQRHTFPWRRGECARPPPAEALPLTQVPYR